MGETPKKDNGGKEDEANAASSAKQTAAERKAMSIRLLPVANSDQPVVANYCEINLAPGMAFVDFGFLEPAMLAALPRVARSGGKLPDKLSGRLAVRVALGYDSLAGLHQQLGQVLKGLSAARGAGARKTTQ